MRIASIISKWQWRASIVMFLTEADSDFIERAMTAAARGPFFPEWEFSILFGLDRSELLAIIDAWPIQTVDDDTLRSAILNSLNNLWGYPHGYNETLVSYLPEGSDAIPPVMERVRLFFRAKAEER